MAVAAAIVAKKFAQENWDAKHTKEGRRKRKLADEEWAQKEEIRLKELELAKAIGPPKHKDPLNFPENSFFYNYLKLSNKSEALIEGDRFNGFIIGIIIVAGILVGLQTYSYFDNNSYLEGCDLFVLVIFGIEVILKTVAEGLKPHLFFIGEDWRWNNFDFFVLILSLPIWGDTFGGSSVALLRLMRLMRVMKLVKKIPQLQMIIMGLVGGMKSIGYIMVLLFLVFYLYAVVGIYSFRANDPFHFGDLFKALNTLFRMATLEDWTDVMYINYYGCGAASFDSGIYTTIEEEANGQGFLYCAGDKRVELQGFTVVYFSSFIVISALVMLSLFIGAVTMSMTESMQEMKLEKENSIRRKRLMKMAEKKKRQIKKTESQALLNGLLERSNSTNSLESIDSENDVPLSLMRTKSNTAMLHQSSANLMLSNVKSSAGLKKSHSTVNIHHKYPSTKNSFDMVRMLSMKGVSSGEPGVDGGLDSKALKACITQAWEDVDLLNLVNDVDIMHDRLRDETNSSVGKLYLELAEMSDRLTTHPTFTNFITLVIVAAGIMVGAQTYEELNDGPQADLMAVIDSVILGIFVAEVVLKMVAKGFRPQRYFFYKGEVQGWNCFDLIVVAGSFLPGSGSFLVVLRLLRLLRVLKLVRSLPELQVIVVALIDGLSSISYIGVILFMVFYVFAILGMIMFAENDPWHFATLHISLFTLLRCATLEDWTEIMYVNMYGCNLYGYVGKEDLCTNPKSLPTWAAMFFIVFTVVGALVLMTLFIGVVTTAMEEATSSQNEQKAMADKVEKFRAQEGIERSSIELYEQVFKTLDLDESGSVTENEMSFGLATVGKDLDQSVIHAMFKAVDDDDNGEIDFSEFVEFLWFLQKTSKENQEKKGKSKATVDPNVIEEGDYDEEMQGSFNHAKPIGSDKRIVPLLADEREAAETPEVDVSSPSCRRFSDISSLKSPEEMDLAEFEHEINDTTFTPDFDVPSNSSGKYKVTQVVPM